MIYKDFKEIPESIFVINNKQYYIDKKRFRKKLIYKFLTFISITFIFVFAIMVDNLCIRTIGLVISVDTFGIVAFNEGKSESE